MADDAELAFLNAQKEYDPATAYNPEADQESESENAYSPQDQSEESASPPQSAVQTPAAGEEGANGFKPQPATTSAEASAAPTPSKQPRTRGGFVDESEDEEEESVAQPQVGTVPTNADAPQRSITNTPNNTLPTPDVQSLSAQDQGASSLLPASVAVPESVPSVVSVPNGSAPVPDATKPTAPEHLTVASARQSAAPLTPVPTSAVSSLPKARLPQDRIGILEDRIAEDPRGDIEAWLSLIDEHRRRHKHDEARAVFERFLKTFPSSVSHLIVFSFCQLTKLTCTGRAMGRIHCFRNRARRIRQSAASLPDRSSAGAVCTAI